MAEVSFLIQPRPAAADLSDLSRALTRTRGVTAVRVDPAASQVTLVYDPRQNDTFGLAAAVGEAGFTVVTTSATLSVTGMTCASCAFHVESALTDVPGVIEAGVDLRSGTAVVIVVADGVNWPALCRAVEEAGYRANVLISAF
jgi:P-type Cu+ transporter